MSLEATRITELTTLTAPKAIFREWLLTWFDGLEHVVGTNAPVSFPLCRIDFALGRDEQPKTQCSIRLVILPRGERSWWNNDSFFAEHKRTSSGVLLNFWIKAKAQGVGQSELLASRVAQLLKAVLTNPDANFPLKERGITALTPQEPQPMPTAEEAVYLVACGAEFYYAQMLTGSAAGEDVDGGNALLTLSAQNASFMRENAIVPGSYLLGLAQWTVAMRLIRVRAAALASVGADTVLELEVNGTLTGVQLRLAAGLEGEEVGGALGAPGYTVPAEGVCRWKCVGAPGGAELGAWQASLVMEVVPVA